MSLGQRRRQSSPRAVAPDGNGARVTAEGLRVLEHVAGHGDGVLDPGWEAMLRGEAVVHRDDDRVSLLRECAADAVVRIDRSHDEPAAVEVDEDGARRETGARLRDARRDRAARPEDHPLRDARGNPSVVDDPKRLLELGPAPLHAQLVRLREPDARGGTHEELRLDLEDVPVRRDNARSDEGAQDRRRKREYPLESGALQEGDDLLRSLGRHCLRFRPRVPSVVQRIPRTAGPYALIRLFSGS